MLKRALDLASVGRALSQLDLSITDPVIWGPVSCTLNLVSLIYKIGVVITAS